MDCRPGCAACCVAPSITSPIPPGPGGEAGLPDGKPAGLPCPRLLGDLRCSLFGQPERPAVCSSLGAEPEMCGGSAAEALAWLGRVEAETAPPT